MIRALIFILFGILKVTFPKLFRIYYFYEVFEGKSKQSDLELIVERLFGLTILIYGIYLIFKISK